MVNTSIAPNPGEPVSLRSGRTGFVSQKLSRGLDLPPSTSVTWRVLVKDPDVGHRRATITATHDTFLWKEVPT